MHFQAWTAICRALLAAVLLTIASADLVRAEEESSSSDSPELSPAVATPSRDDTPEAAAPSQAITPIPLIPSDTDPPETTFDLGPGPDFFGGGSRFRVVELEATGVDSPEPAAEAVVTAEPEPDAADPILADATSELVEVETQLAARRAELKRHEAELEKKEREISLRQAKISSSNSELAVVQEQLAKKRA